MLKKFQNYKLKEVIDKGYKEINCDMKKKMQQKVVNKLYNKFYKQGGYCFKPEIFIML